MVLCSQQVSLSEMGWSQIAQRSRRCFLLAGCKDVIATGIDEICSSIHESSLYASVNISVYVNTILKWHIDRWSRRSGWYFKLKSSIVELYSINVILAVAQVNWLNRAYCVIEVGSRTREGIFPSWVVSILNKVRAVNLNKACHILFFMKYISIQYHRITHRYESPCQN